MIEGTWNGHRAARWFTVIRKFLDANSASRNPPLERNARQGPASRCCGRPLDGVTIGGHGSAMAINQVSLFFYPSGWRQRLTPDPRLMTSDGETVQIADAVRDPSGDGHAVAGGELKDWLSAQGFTVADWGQGGVFERGRVKSIFGHEKEIQIQVGEEAGEVVELYCRFTLPRRAAPPPLAEWAAFVASLCEQFGMRLDPAGAGPCGEAGFIAAVLENRNYQDFAAAFGWKAPAR